MLGEWVGLCMYNPVPFPHFVVTCGSWGWGLMIGCVNRPA
jgi:hypothetical protein